MASPAFNRRILLVALIGLFVLVGLGVVLSNRLYSPRRLPVEELKKVKTGATEFQVRLTLGEPHRVLKNERTYWRYDGRSARDFLIVRFTNGRVTDLLLRENDKTPPTFEELDELVFSPEKESPK